MTKLFRDYPTGKVGCAMRGVGHRSAQLSFFVWGRANFRGELPGRFVEIEVVKLERSRRNLWR
jgi:hypothetical protein